MDRKLHVALIVFEKLHVFVFMKSTKWHHLSVYSNEV